MATVGEVHIIPAAICKLEWRIPNFKSLSEETVVNYTSPVFECNGIPFYLFICPNGFGKYGPIYLSLITQPLSPTLINLEVSFALNTSDGKKYRETNCTEHLVFDTCELYGTDSFLFRTELFEKESELLPSGALTVLCTMKNLKSIEDENNEALIRDLKKMLSDGKNHDLILKIGDKELRAHRDILRSRSHVFESMLNHDMKEKNSGIIDVPDCKPEAMELFLLYIYTGKVQALDQRRMLGLYYIADKYEMQGLIKECRNFIKKSLSHTNICDVIQLAVNHSDSGLLEHATEYFIENALDITVTVEWQSFLKDNTTLGNELIIKSFRKLKDVKS